METFLGLAGLGLCLIGLSFLINGFPSITINRHYHIKKKKDGK